MAVKIPVYPEGEKVFILPDKPDEQIGSIIVPQSVRDSRQMVVQKGEVIAVGPAADLLFSTPDEERRPLKVGDRVMFVKHSYVEFRYQNKDERTDITYWVVLDKDILGLEV